MTAERERKEERTMSKHTPGLWVEGERHETMVKIVVIDEDATKIVAVCRGGVFGCDEMDANAALIARAPEMHAELLALREEAGSLRGTLTFIRLYLVDSPRSPLKTTGEALDLIDAALTAGKEKSK